MVVVPTVVVVVAVVVVLGVYCLLFIATLQIHTLSSYIKALLRH